MDVQKSLDPRSQKRYVQTRRFTGRRGLTPMRSKHRKSIPKTRGHRVEKKHVQLPKYSNTKHDTERRGSDANEHGEGQEGEGNKDSSHSKEREDTEKHTSVDQGRDTEDSEESVHPGPVQTLPELSEQTAVHETSDKKEIEAEVLPPWT